MSHLITAVKFNAAQNVSTPKSEEQQPNRTNPSSLTKRIPRVLLLNAMSFLTGSEVCLVSRVDKLTSELASSDFIWSAVARNVLSFPPQQTRCSKWQVFRLFMHANIFGEEIRRKAFSRSERSHLPRNENTNPFHRFEGLKSFLFSEHFTLLQAVNFESADISYQTREAVIKILLQRQKPTEKELISVIDLCRRGPYEQEKEYQARRAFAFRIIALFSEKGANVDSQVLNGALSCNFPIEKIKSFLMLGAKPNEETLDIALQHAPGSVTLLLENGAKPSENSLGHAFAAWREKGIDEETLERIQKMHFEPKEAAISLGVLKKAIFANISFARLRPLFDHALKQVSEDKRNEFFSELLRFTLETSPKYKDENSRIVLDHLMSQVAQPTTLHLNVALFNGQPLAVIKTLFEKGARFDQNSFQNALKAKGLTDEVVDFLTEKEAPFQIEPASIIKSTLAELPLPILRKVLPLVQATNEYDAIEAMNRKLPIDVLEKIFSLSGSIPDRVFVLALKEGYREAIPLLMNKFGKQISTQCYYDGQVYISNSFNDALKFSAEKDWIDFVSGLGAFPEYSEWKSENSCHLAVIKGASDTVLDSIKSQGISFHEKTFEEALHFNVPMRILHWLVKNQAPFHSDCWNERSAFSSLERFKLLYDYAKRKKVPLPENFFDLAVSKAAPLEVLEFLLSENFHPSEKALNKILPYIGKMPTDELTKIMHKLFCLGIKMGNDALHAAITRATVIDCELLRYPMNLGAIPNYETFRKLFSKDIPQDVFEMMIKIYLQMRNFSTPPKTLEFDDKHSLYVTIYPLTEESKSEK